MSQDPNLPFHTFQYQLTAKDMLAWCVLRSDWSNSEKLVGLGVIIAIGFTLASLPETLVGRPYELRFILAIAAALALGYGLFRLIFAINDRRLAARAIPLPRAVTLEEWGDHLHEKWDGGDCSIAPEMIEQVLETPTHVFVKSASSLIIIPAFAFDSPAHKYAFAANLDKQSKEKPSWEMSAD